MDLQARIETIKRDNDRKKEEKNRIEGKLDSLKQQMKEPAFWEVYIDDFMDRGE